MCKYGIGGGNLDWYINYLSNRSQRTLANGILSDEEVVTCGVPQGSVLGPLFFILYVNDMQSNMLQAHVQFYADDTVICTSGRNIDEAAMKLEPTLKQFSKWCHANKLSLNTSKTKLVVFGTRYKVKKAKNVKVKLENDYLQVVPTYKYLGFTLDSTLSFNYLVNSVVSMVAFKVNLLARTRRFLTDETAIKI